MNPYQRIVADTYAGGEFADASWPYKVGDTLFTFLMLELDNDCESWAEAQRRVARAIEQLQDVLVVMMS